MKMSTGRKIETDHEAFICDVAYDLDGRRMATCSNDHVVKIWDQLDNGQWVCTASWTAHHDSVRKVAWADPYFGGVIVTCSVDRTAVIWQETKVRNSIEGEVQTQWVKRKTISDCKTPFTDARFAPKHLGLQLATCSYNGHFRVWKALILKNLRFWGKFGGLRCNLYTSCLAWSPSSSPLIAVGSDSTNPSLGGKVLLLEPTEKKWFWQVSLSIDCINEPVLDLTFAPSMARSYDMLAVAGEDVFIIAITRKQYRLSEFGTEIVVEQLCKFSDHGSAACRLSWNSIGTILASSGDDRCVRLFGQADDGVWQRLAVTQNCEINTHRGFPHEDKVKKPAVAHYAGRPQWLNPQDRTAVCNQSI